MKEKTKLTRLWSILLTLVLLVGLLPTTALADSSLPTASADFTVNEATSTAALALLNAAKTDGAADSEWNNTTKTLTLNGVNFETTALDAVKLPGGTTIVLTGVNTITGGPAVTKNDWCCGIRVEGDLTISGTGSLTVTGGNTGPIYDSYGIYTDGGDINITGGTVNATGGTAGTDSYGIFLRGSSGSVGSVNISGGIVTATGGTANRNSYGIFLRDSSGSVGSVNISGGTVIAEANNFALNKQPTLPITGYSWRTSDSNDYSEFPGTAYEWSSSHSYVEIKSNPTISITSVAITGIDAPVSNTALDTTAACATTGVNTTTVTWNPNPDDNKAGYGATYTASVTLTAADGYAFADDAAVTVNGNPATSVTKNANGTLTVTYTFPATDKHNIEITVDTAVRGGDAAKNPTISSGYEFVFCFFAEDTDGDGDFSDDKTWVVDKTLVEAFVAQSEGQFTYERVMAAIKSEFGLDELKTEFTGGCKYSVYATVAHDDGAEFDYDADNFVTNAIVTINDTDKTAVCKATSDYIYFLPSTDIIVFTAGTPTTPPTPPTPPHYTPPPHSAHLQGGEHGL